MASSATDLQIQVDRQLEVLARNRVLHPQHFPFAAAVVDHDLPLPVDAHQCVVVFAFDPGLPMTSPGSYSMNSGRSSSVS